MVQQPTERIGEVKIRDQMDRLLCSIKRDQHGLQSTGSTLDRSLSRSHAIELNFDIKDHMEPDRLRRM